MKFSISDLSHHGFRGALPLRLLAVSLCALALALGGRHAYSQETKAQDAPAKDTRTVAQSSAAPYVKVEFGAYVAEHRSPQRIIPMRPDRVRFVAKVLSAPEPVQTDYLMGVLRLTGVDPLPRVSKKVFLQAEDGTTQGVYLLESAAAQVKGTTPVGGHATFYGFRAYDYSKGPAILIEKIGGANE